MKKLTFLLFASMLLFACGDACDDIDCGPNGTCQEDSESCLCDDWYEGDRCETETRAKFLGTWSSTSPCEIGSTVTDPDWTISEAATADSFIFQSPDVISNTIFTATLTSANQANITAFSQAGADFSGTISYINETTMSMVVNVESSGSSITCNYALSK